MKDYADPLVQIQILLTKLHGELNDNKVTEATAILDDIGVQMNLIYDWIDRQ